MKRLFLLTNIVLLSLLALSFCTSPNCLRGKGEIKTENRNLTGFYGIDFNAVAEVEITYAKDWSVQVSDYENLLPNLKTEVKDGVLKIYNEKCVHNSKCKIKITMPQLNEIVYNGVGTLTVSGEFDPAKIFEMDYNGVGELDWNAYVSDVCEFTLKGVGDLNLNFPKQLLSLNLIVSGVGDFTASGQGVKKLYVEVSGTGDSDLEGLPAQYAVIKASGMGNVDVFVTDVLKITASGLGDVSYSGNPKKVEFVKN